MACDVDDFASWHIVEYQPEFSNAKSNVIDVKAFYSVN
jgi:hypothetical protein